MTARKAINSLVTTHEGASKQADKKMVADRKFLKLWIRFWRGESTDASRGAYDTTGPTRRELIGWSSQRYNGIVVLYFWSETN